MHLLKFFFFKIFNVTNFFSNTNIVKEHSMHWIIKASVRSVVSVDFWCKFCCLSSFISFTEVFRTRSNLSLFVKTRGHVRSLVHIPGRSIFFMWVPLISIHHLQDMGNLSYLTGKLMEMHWAGCRHSDKRRVSTKAPGESVNHDQQLLHFCHLFFSCWAVHSGPLPWTSWTIILYFVVLSHLLKLGKTTFPLTICPLLIHQFSWLSGTSFSW